MARTPQRRFLRATNISGNVKELNPNAGSSANNSTVARYAAGGTTSARRWNPVAVSTADAPLPSGGTNAANMGWRDANAENADEAIQYEGANWRLKLRYRRSGQVLEVDQVANVTVIFYRVSATGVFISELDRATLNQLVFTTTVKEADLAVFLFPTAFEAGDRVQVEVYVVTTLNELPAAPAVATDLWYVIEEAANGAEVSIPNYIVVFRRTADDSATPTEEATRAVVNARSVDDSAEAMDSVSSFAIHPRTADDEVPVAVDAPEHLATLFRSGTDSAGVVDVATRLSVFFRRSTNDISDFAEELTRVLIMVRGAEDNLGVAQVRNVEFALAGLEMTETVDEAFRVVVNGRTPADDASAEDDGMRMVVLPRTTDEVTEVLVEPIRTIYLGRLTADVTSLTDEGVRNIPLTGVVYERVAFDKVAGKKAPFLIFVDQEPAIRVAGNHYEVV